MTSQRRRCLSWRAKVLACAGAWLALLSLLQQQGADAVASRGIRTTLPLLRERMEAQRAGPCGAKDLPQSQRVPNVTHSGYVGVSGSESNGDAIFTVFYESQESTIPLEERPIVVWLQGGPGCSSLFGMLYINGPYFVNERDLTLRSNPGSWNRLYGLLYVDQPLGTGFSLNGKRRIPSNELEVADDLYRALNNWYRQYPQYQRRPLIVTGESYAGKYVPSISHYVLQADAQAHGYLAKLDHPRAIGQVEAPLFKLGGLAIGNGWTDADSQQLVQGDVAWAMGLIDLTMKHQVDALNLEVLDQLKSKNWVAARALSDRVNGLIANWSATQTLEDVRRNTGYDGRASVDAYLNQRHVKERLGVDLDLEWVSCSPEVDRKMGHDVMKSVRPLVVDLLQFHPVLLYQGQFDAECGVASNDAWIQTMKWPGHYDFNHKPRDIWMVNNRALGYWRQHLHLTQLVVRNTGHMVPHDNPYYGQLLLERWIEEQVRGAKYTREFSAEEEALYLCMRGSDEGPTANPDLPPGDAPWAAAAAASR